MLYLLQMAFICGFCGASLKTKDTLRPHENRHRNVGKYNCESCGKVSFSKANAEMHAASHKEEKRLTCMNCGKKFTYLNRHIRREMCIGKN